MSFLLKRTLASILVPSNLVMSLSVILFAPNGRQFLANSNQKRHSHVTIGILPWSEHSNWYNQLHLTNRQSSLLSNVTHQTTVAKPKIASFHANPL